MLQHPLRVGGLALGCAVATATLAMVTFLVSNLVLAVVAGIGLVDRAEVAAAADRDPAVRGVLVAAEPDDGRSESDRVEGQACQRRADRKPDREVRVRCGGQRVLAGGSRP